MNLLIQGIPTKYGEWIWRGGTDAHGQIPLREIAEGPANPCRHCLQLIRPGETKLVLAYCPFPEPQPYAETGPIFLHAQACSRYSATVFPSWFDYLDPALARGYGDNHRIRYETGTVVPGPQLTRTCTWILDHCEVAYVHIRSKFNCFQGRVERA